MPFKDKTTEILRIGIFAVVVASVVVAIFTMWETHSKLEELSQVINNFKKTSERLDTTIRKIQHQTIDNAYVTSAPFDVKLQSCGKEERWDPDGNYEGVIWFCGQ